MSGSPRPSPQPGDGQWGFSRRWGPIGLVVVCGLGSSTLLTLLLAPALYSLLDDLGAWLRRVVRVAGIA